MGSPEFAVPSLRALIDAGHEVVAVFTQPDRPAGRGQKLAPPPVKAVALEYGLDVRQPPSISAPDVVEEIRPMQPDLGVIAAYGQLLKQRLLDVPKLGILNVHASLLPRWRGAAPVSAAILAGDAESGATIMRVVRELDAGPMLAHARVPIRPSDTTGTLTERIADAGADLLVKVLPRYASGELVPVEQDTSLVTYAPQLKKTDALLDFARDDAETVARMVRAYNPWPGAYAYLDGEPLRILECTPVQHNFKDEAGTIFAFGGIGEPAEYDAAFGVVCRSGEIAVERVQAPGGKPMLAAAWLRGHGHVVGKRLGVG